MKVYSAVQGIITIFDPAKHTVRRKDEAGIAASRTLKCGHVANMCPLNMAKHRPRRENRLQWSTT